MTAEPSHETWARSLETEPSVTVTEETFFGHGWQPLTLATLQAIWFLPATAEFSVEQLVAWFGALGWKSANGKPLGEDAVRRELALIRKAGYVRAYRVKGEGGRMAGMRYEVSKRQMAPQERIGVLSGKSAKPQVTPCASNEGTWSLPGMGKTESHRSHHVPPLTTHGDPPYMADQEKPQVAPCASNGGFPPTPPLWEEEAYSSSQKPSSVTAVTPDVPAAAVTAAAEFLAELPGRWACGRRSAQELAPLLAEAVVAQGWVLGEALVQQLTSCRIPPRKLPAQVLAEQIEDLPRYRAAARKAPALAHRPARERPTPVRIPEQRLPLEDGEHTPAADTAAAVPVEQLRQARELLGTLTGPWALSPQSADRLAPVLAVTAVERGWAFDDRLRTELMKNPGGVHNYELILETHRIGRLPDRASTVPGHSRRTATSSRQKAIDACTRCDAYGQIEGPGGAAVLCKHDTLSAPAEQTAPAPSVTDGHGLAADAAGAQKVTDRKLADLFAAMTKADI